MPRDGLSQYAPPPGTNGITNYTIESTKYNGFVADITADQNNPRPIVAGGTGANNAQQAMLNLSGEIATQQVTNYDSFAFAAGSFWSAVGATSAPTPTGRYTGICTVLGDGTGDIDIEATSLATALTYNRRKNGGVWTTWTQRAGASADLDAAYVNVAGDTMAGSLGLAYSSSNSVNVALQNTISGGHAWSVASSGGGPSPLGSLVFYDSTASIAALTITAGGATAAFNGTVTAGNLGTTGTYYFGNSGTKYLNYDGAQFNFSGGDLRITGGNLFITHLTAPTTGYCFFGNTSTKYLDFDGTNFNLIGGQLLVSANAVFSGFGGATGGYYFGNSGGKYLTYDGTNFNLVGGPLCAGATASGLVSGDICSARSSTSGYYFFGSSSKSLSYDVSVGYFTFTGGPLQLGTGFSGRTGIGGTYAASPYTHNFQWNGSLIAWVDSTAVGTITLASDYRIKKDVIDLPGMWDTVKALRPIKYTQAQFSPPSHVNYIAAEVLKARMEVEENPEAKPREVNVGPLYPADDIERWGFIAHELQATLVPSAATGEKDSPDTIQSPNPFTIIAALTKALQEAMTRIEALEQKVAPVGQPVTR